MIKASLFTLLAGLLLSAGALGDEPPSRPGADAPELARLGDYAVGVRTVTFVQRDQADPLTIDPATVKPAREDRSLTVDLWYPASVPAGATPETYTATLPSEPPAPPARFSIAGLAVRDARAAGGRYPLVIVSHGYSNATVAMSWLTENLASKGYVVAAIRHEDPDISDRSKFAKPFLRRPLDIAFVAAQLRASLGSEGLVDPSRIALVGYSMGGYGVLTAAGATLDPSSPLAKLMPAGLLAPYVRGGAERDAIRVRNVRAVVAVSPAGGGQLAAWGSDGLADLTAPLLLISGDSDHTVDYTTGARAFFDAAVGAPRYLLTYKGGGHAIGLDGAPESMRHTLWDLSWFEDPVWRKERIIAINLHMITAFLDRYVKDDAGRAAYLDGLVPESGDGRWPATAVTRFDAYSPGSGEISVWKGFQRNYATALELLQSPARAAGR